MRWIYGVEYKVMVYLLHSIITHYRVVQSYGWL